MQLSDFLSAIETKSFVGDARMQEEMTLLALKSSDFEILWLLCSVAQFYPHENFPINALTRHLCTIASVEQLVEVVRNQTRLPLADMLEKIFSRGDVEQIKKVSDIRASWIYKQKG